MSRTAHELALLTQVEALVTNLRANNFAGSKGFTETYFFNAENLDGGASLFFEAPPTLRGRLLSISYLNITTDLTAGGATELGKAGTTTDYMLRRVHLLEADNENDATDQDGVANIYPFLGGPLGTGGIGAANVIPISQASVLTLVDVSSDTGIMDVFITIEWFE